MSKIKKILPDLRFPEFKDSGEWEKKKISDLGHTINGLTGKNGEDFGAGKPYVTYKQVFDNSIIDFKKCGKVQIGKNENQNSLQMGDVLFTTSSETPNEVGFASVLVNSPKEETYLNSFCFALRPFDIEKTQPQFFRYLFYSPIYRKSVTAIAQGSTRYNLSKGAFLELQIPIPNPKEQQKIAACLSSLDELISAHSQKLELLKAHKKGLMQNLFPQNGKKVPKLRFKEFEKDGEWENPILSKVSDVIMGSSPSSISYNENKIGLPLLQGNTDIKNRLSAPRIYTTEITKECKVGDILLSVRAPVGTVAKSIHNACIGRGISALRAKKPNSQEYLYQWLFSYESSWGKISQGGTFDAVNSDDVRNLLVPIPSPKEQQKIASCLSSLDELITAQSKKIEQLKQHKKGLMQGLFPKINE